MANSTTFLNGSPNLQPVSDLEMDSVIVCDDLPPLSCPRLAGAGDGRFVFALGNLRVPNRASEVALSGRGQTASQYASFDLDVNDLFLSKRTRFCVRDLYALGTGIRFHALDERTAVITDYNDRDKLIRQRLVRLDWSTGTTECALYRTYATVLEPRSVQTLIGEEWSITWSDDRGLLVYPSNPLNPAPLRDITLLKEKAIEGVSHLYQGGVNPDAVDVTSPFIISTTALGFFIRYNNSFDLVTALVLDWISGRFYLQTIERAPIFPLFNPLMASIETSQAIDGEVFTTVRYDTYAPIYGRLNTRTLEWTDLVMGEGSIVPCRGGSCIVVASAVIAPATCSIRAMIGAKKEEAAVCRLRLSLLRPQFRVPSLVRLASIAVQRSGRVPAKQLQQIANRIG